MLLRHSYLALFLASPLLAQSQAGVQTSGLSATRLPAPARLAIDGRLSEPAWHAASAVTELRQHDPDVGQHASERTEVRVLFDSTTLWIGVLAFDSRPSEVIARILARDQLMSLDPFSGQLDFAGDDAVAILLDPFRDRRNAIVFATNPNGAEFDAQVTDQGREVNVAWRTVWRVAAARHDSGWSAEFEIPLRSLRVPADGRAWGFNVYRVIRRKNEHAMWRSWSRDNAGFLRVSEAGELRALTGIARVGLGVELKTSGIGRAVAGDVSGRTAPVDGALDVKYEVRPGVTADVTVNTDFAQAEVDDVQVNLTRFDLFFPEKRDFFLENAGVFEFGTRGVFEPPPWLMFFSRRIGISDSGEVPVLGGVRLTGRSGSQTFGFMHMQTAAAFDQRRTGYSAARFKRDVGGGYMGAMYAGHSPDDRPGAGSGGLDFQAWPTPRTNVQGFAAAVWDSATGGVSSATSAHRLVADHQVDRFGVRLERMVFGERADPPLGFATRTGIQRTDAQLRLTTRPDLPALRRFEMYTFLQYVARSDGALQDWGVGPALDFTLHSGDNVTVYRLQSVTVLDDPFDVAGRLPVAAGTFGNSQTGGFLNTAAQRPVSAQLHVNHQAFYGGTWLMANATATAALGSRVSLGLTRVFNDIRVPAGDLVANVSAARVAVAFSTRATLAGIVQYDALDRRATGNLRLAYMYRPGSELFVVLNGEREPGMPPASRRRTALVKLTYLARI